MSLRNLNLKKLVNSKKKYLQGTFKQGKSPGGSVGTHYFNQENNRWAFVDKNGEFRSAWSLTAEQKMDLLKNRNVGA